LIIPCAKSEGETIRDVNIWDEPDEKTQLLEGSEMKAGTLNKLVTKLTSEKEPGIDYLDFTFSFHDSHSTTLSSLRVDIPFMKTFLMTYQSFATPQKLLSKLIERYPFYTHTHTHAHIFGPCSFNSASLACISHSIFHQN